jgi:hypothetical protein
VQYQVQYPSGTGGRRVTGWTIYWVDDLADGNQLSGLQPTPWTIGHGLLSGRPQVRVLPGAPCDVARHRRLMSRDTRHRVLLMGW